jgi:hypothetical protein
LTGRLVLTTHALYFQTMLKAMLHSCYSIFLELFNFDSTNFIPFLHFEYLLKGMFFEG